MKNQSKLEKWSWIAGISGAILSTAFTAYSLVGEKTNVQPVAHNQAVQTAHGVGNVQVGGVGNTVVTHAVVTTEQDYKVQVGVITPNRHCNIAQLSTEVDCYQNRQQMLDYAAFEDSQKIRILPNIDKLISPPKLFNDENAGLRFPYLDIKFVNNSKATFFINRIDLVDIKSKLDENVYLHTNMSCNSRHLKVVNHNRTKVDDVDRLKIANAHVRFNLTYKESKSPEFHIALFEKNRLKVVVGTDDTEVDLLTPFLSIGLDLNKISKINREHGYRYESYGETLESCESDKTSGLLNEYHDFCRVKPLSRSRILAKKYLSALSKIGVLNNGLPHIKNGKLVDPMDYPIIEGVVEYDIFDYQKMGTRRISTPFRDEIKILSSFGCGSGEYPSETYSTKLQYSGENYSIQIPVAQSIKSGEVDRIKVKLAVDYASYHELRIIIRSLNGKSVSLKPIDIYTP